jgi:hypothetical protein
MPFSLFVEMSHTVQVIVIICFLLLVAADNMDAAA